MLESEEIDTMNECKHGLRSGCIYCHAATPARARQTGQTAQKSRTKSSRISEQMNDRMTTLKQRLRKLRGE
jgi:hypothetical protein